MIPFTELGSDPLSQDVDGKTPKEMFNGEAQQLREFEHNVQEIMPRIDLLVENYRAELMRQQEKSQAEQPISSKDDDLDDDYFFDDLDDDEEDTITHDEL